MFSYYSSRTQIVILGFVCFFCPGMFNALNGMGGGGQKDQTIGNNANTALYACFTVFGLTGGMFVNMFGVRLCMFVTGLFYALYSGSYIYLNNTGKGGFTIAAGALLGLACGIFWAAQGMIMMSYPREQEKGLFITIFWIIFNFGGVIGGILPFAINFNNDTSLSNGAYAGFIALECVGSCLAWALAPPSKVRKTDGTLVQIKTNPEEVNIRNQVVGILKTFRYPLTAALIPLSLSSNFYYSYEFSVYNGELFTTRTRGFNNIFYWAAEMVASIGFSRILDNKNMTRRKRGLIALILVTVLLNICWGGALAVQLQYSKTKQYPGGIIDFLDGGRAVGPIILYVYMGACDALWQNMAYWLLGALTNDADTSAHYAGFYKGMQSLGAVVAWQLAAQKVSFIAQLVVNWVLIDLSLPTMYYVVLRIQDSSYDKETADGDDNVQEGQHVLGESSDNSTVAGGSGYKNVATGPDDINDMEKGFDGQVNTYTSSPAPPVYSNEKDGAFTPTGSYSIANSTAKQGSP
ncbi:hypothetical protein H4219_003375 [Mycoemilia scoparia]|uniref:MFS general substrate transporter n=1 Tax=Mycoemilia scoparia TaxID=417184 RepID=A0A9W7ZUW7_9FUNG|nr:hypothetical protein H4219_003375 [Mycoemilia scoparia]